MPNKQKKFSIRTWWLSLSIQYKIGMFLAMVVIMVIILGFFSLTMSSIHIREVNDILGESYAVSHALSSFESEKNTFIDLYMNPTSDNQELFYNARLQTSTAIDDLYLDYINTGLSRYLLIQAVQNAYGVYTQNCTELLNEKNTTANSITQYYVTLNIASYISSYLQDLMQFTLSEGTQQYSDKMRYFRKFPIISNILAILIIIFALLFGTVTIKHIIIPVLQLAKDARKISENNLDFSDIKVNNKDEIGELVEAFNMMKHSMSSHIQSIQDFRIMENKLHQEEISRIAMEQEMQSIRLSMLQSQINPHFLFNTLNTIRITAKIEGAKNTEELIQRLANLLRYNLETADRCVPLERELNIIQDYMFIQRRRFGDRLRFKIECDSDIDITKISVPTFTLQPLIENSVIHGITPLEEGGEIKLQVQKKEDYIIVTITDNGQGISPDQMQTLLDTEKSQKGHVSQIGMGNVRTRLKMLYPTSKFEIISSLGEGTTVRLSVPYLY